MFIDLRRDWWYFIIGNIISECIDFLIRHVSQIVCQSTSSSEYVFFSFALRLFYLSTSSLCNFSLSTSSMLINFFITYRTWFPSLSSLESSDSFSLVSKFLAISYLWMLRMLVTTCKTKLILWKTLIMFIA